jgi:hypothetical protein
LRSPSDFIEQAVSLCKYGPWEEKMALTLDIAESEFTTGHFRHASENSGGLAQLSEFYRQLGFESGYAQAARDQLEASVVMAEQVLLEQGNSLRSSADARRLLYSFIAKVERRLSLFAGTSQPESIDARQEGFLEGGLGI